MCFFRPEFSNVGNESIVRRKYKEGTGGSQGVRGEGTCFLSRRLKHNALRGRLLESCTATLVVMVLLLAVRLTHGVVFGKLTSPCILR